MLSPCFGGGAVASVFASTPFVFFFPWPIRPFFTISLSLSRFFLFSHLQGITSRCSPVGQYMPHLRALIYRAARCHLSRVPPPPLFFCSAFLRLRFSSADISHPQISHTSHPPPLLTYHHISHTTNNNSVLNISLLSPQICPK